MVDLERRAQLGHSLRQFSEGKITNDQFCECCDAQDWRCGDSAIRAIVAFAFGLCEDERTFRLTDPGVVAPETLEAISRCCRFLGSGREYQWPEAPSTALARLAGGAAVFLALPLGIVLLVAAVMVRDGGYAGLGVVVLVLSGWMFWAYRRTADERTPEWQTYWSRGDRAAWPFLQVSDY